MSQPSTMAHCGIGWLPGRPKTMQNAAKTTVKGAKINICPGKQQPQEGWGVAGVLETTTPGNALSAPASV